MIPVVDAKGKSWELNLNVAVAQRLRDEAQIDIHGAIGGDLLFQLQIPNVFIVGAMLWVLCRDQIRSLELTEDSFAACWDGGTLTAAGEAISQLVIGFFPKQTALLTTIADRSNALSKAMCDQMEDKLQKITVERLLSIVNGDDPKSTGSESPSVLPDSPDSIPATAT